jgi:hypothetical protein
VEPAAGADELNIEGALKVCVVSVVLPGWNNALRNCN